MRRLNFKRINAFMCSIMLMLASVITVMPTAHAVGTNLVANPSAEENVAGSPTGWTKDRWGTNTTTFNYLSTGHTGSHSMEVSTTARSSGDAKWFFTPISVKPNTSYTFSDWYQSNVATGVDLVVTTTGNTTSYLHQGDPAASTSWKQNTYTFTTPANAAKVTVYHYLEKVGHLTVDDYSLVDNTDTTTPPPAPTPPAVSVSAPANGATVNGTVALSANASDDKAVSNVQFKVDGTNVGSADTTAPYGINWNTTAVGNGTHAITAVATDSDNLTTTSSTVSVNVSNIAAPTAPTVSLTAPAANATISGTTAISANASDAKGVAGVQFKVDGTNVGAEDTTSPYSVSLDTKTVTNGTHTLTATARNLDGLTATDSETVTVNNTTAPTAPTVSVTAPTAGATLSGTTALSANASDAKSVTSVQFKVDGANVGVADTTAPYSVSWDTKTVSNGNHTVTAVATNSSSLTTTSSVVTVTVNNTVTPPPSTTNLLANPSFETAQNATTPASWMSSNWGNNTSKFTYLNTGHTGNRSVEAQISSYTNGAANWYYNEVPVTAGKTYEYSTWYKSNVDTEIDAEVTMNDGSIQYFWLGNVFASTNWAQNKTTFTVPAGAKSMAVYQILAKVGYLTTDDVSLSEYVPAQYNRGLVSVTFDDGWANQYKNAVPLLNQLGIKSTFYIISGELNDQPDYMSGAQVKDLYAKGHEIGSHTVTHPDLTKVGATRLKREMANSQATLQNLIGAPVTDFAYPYGAYNQTTINVGKQYYASQRTVNGGYNTKDNLDVTQLKMYEVDSNISRAQVQAWIDGAIAQHSWLILCYHEVADTPVDPSDDLYTTKPADFSAEMQYLKSTGVATTTVRQALAEVQSQQ